MSKFTPTTAWEQRLTESIASNTLIIPVSSVKDRDGNILPISSDNKGYFTLEPGTAREESIVCDDIQESPPALIVATNGRGLSASGDSETGSSDRAFNHNAGMKIIMTDIAQFFGNFVDNKNAETIAGVKTFNSSPIVPTPTADTQVANKSYVDGVAIAGGANASSTVKGISKLSSDPSVLTEPVALNSEEVKTISEADAVVRANEYGLIDGSFVFNQNVDTGLELDGVNATKVKVKTDGGVLIGPDGLSVDSSKVNVLTTMPAYENLVAGDLLKTINDGGTYKLKKIVGLRTTTSGALNYGPISMVFCFIATDKIAVLYAYNNNYYMQVGTISGSTITFGSATTVKNTYNVADAALTLSIKKVSDNKFIIAYPYDNGSNSSSIFARVGTASGTAITLGSETQVYQIGSSVDLVVSDLCEINTSKFVISYSNTGNAAGYTVLTVDNSTNISVGTAKTLSGTDRFLRLVKLETDAFAVFYYNSDSYDNLYRVNTVSTATITQGAEKVFLLFTSSTNDIADSYQVVRTSDNAGIIAYVKKDATTTLIFSYWTRSGDTLTFSTAVSFAGGITNTFTSMEDKIVIFDNYLYFYEMGAGIKKFLFDTSGKFYLIKSYASSLVGSFKSNQFEVAGTSIFTLTGTTPTFTYLLLDHDEFITSANASYNVGDNVPIVERFTGFSSLTAGIDYYINAAASGLTIDSTYQKVGKAINDTTIIK